MVFMEVNINIMSRWTHSTLTYCNISTILQRRQKSKQCLDSNVLRASNHSIASDFARDEISRNWLHLVCPVPAATSAIHEAIHKGSPGYFVQVLDHSAWLRLHTYHPLACGLELPELRSNVPLQPRVNQWRMAFLARWPTCLLSECGDSCWNSIVLPKMCCDNHHAASTKPFQCEGQSLGVSFS